MKSEHDISRREVARNHDVPVCQPEAMIAWRPPKADRRVQRNVLAHRDPLEVLEDQRLALKQGFRLRALTARVNVLSRPAFRPRVAIVSLVLAVAAGAGMGASGWL